MPGVSQKLRSSCDSCGAAKVKCDRIQPVCGRCDSHGTPCVYGISRKMGKPPREGLRASTGRMSRDRRATSDAEQSDTRQNRIGLAPSATFTSTEVPTSWDALDDRAMIDLDESSSLSGALTWPSLSSFPSLDASEWLYPNASAGLSPNVHVGALSLPESPFLEASSSTAISSELQSTPFFTDDKSMSEAQPAGSSGHDFAREACDILRSLCSLNVNQASCTTSTSPPSASPSGTTTDSVPLEHVLRVNREVTERLSSLLECSCATSPHLALLYASIISRVMMWYQQAAGCTLASPPAILPAASTSTSTPSTRVSLTPAKMAIGTFDIDDVHTEAALKVQLLMGEMKRVDRLVNLFTLYCSDGHGASEGHSFGRTDSLYQSLDGWLWREHSSIDSMIRCKLRELNN